MFALSTLVENADTLENAKKMRKNVRKCVKTDLFVPSHNDMHQLRSNDRKLHTEKPNTNFFEKSFSYRGAVSWNSLPSEIVDVHDQLPLSSVKKNHHYNDLEKNTSTI